MPEGSHGRVALAGGAWAHREDIVVTCSRSGGPGGQHVNKVESKATLRIALTAIEGLNDAARLRLASLAQSHLLADGTLTFSSDEHRSQHANREECLDRLRALVLRAARPPRQRRKTKPTRSSKERRLEAKRATGERKRTRGWHAED